MRDDGYVARIFYNQTVLPSGSVFAGAHYYLGSRGQMRPDIVMTFGVRDLRHNAVVIECKHSADRGYLLEGFHEAVLYRTEYAAELRGRLKSILVVSSSITGAIRSDDDVVAADWRSWPPKGVIQELARYASESV